MEKQKSEVVEFSKDKLHLNFKQQEEEVHDELASATTQKEPTSNKNFEESKAAQLNKSLSEQILQVRQRQVKRNGWQKPYHALQIATWIFFGFQ